MAEFLTYVDLTKNELRNVRLQNLASAPANPVDGQIYYDTTLNQPRVYVADAAEWQAMVGASGTVTSVGGTAPIQSSGGTTPVISILPATATDPGSLSAADKVQLNNLQGNLDAKQNTSEKGQANGYASLDGSGLVPSAQLPNIAIGQAFTVADQAAMLALDAQIGDVAIRTDTATRWLLLGDPTVLADWHELTIPEAGVSAVTGADPVTSTGGLTPEIGLAANGITEAYLAQAVIDKLNSGLQRVAQALGDGVATAFTVTHNLGTRNVNVNVYRNSAPYDDVIPDIERTTENTVTIRFTVAPTASQYMAVVS